MTKLPSKGERKESLQNKGVIKFITPVPYAFLPTKKGTDSKDLVVVSLEQLMEAQKRHEEEIEKAREEGREEVVKKLAPMVEILYKAIPKYKRRKKVLEAKDALSKEQSIEE